VWYRFDEATGRAVMKAAAAIVLLSGLASVASAQNECPTIMDVASQRDDLSRVREYIGIAGLEGTLSDPEAELTIFLPNNNAINSFINNLGVPCVQDDTRFAPQHAHDSSPPVLPSWTGSSCSSRGVTGWRTS